MKKNVLVLCTGNSCRSQIAHAYLSQFLGDKAEIFSAGIETHGLNPNAVATLADDGIDIRHYTSNHVDEYAHIPMDVVITVCDNAQESCPIFPSKSKMIHHSFEDPAKFKGTPEEIKEGFAKVRDQIKAFAKDFSERL